MRSRGYAHRRPQARNTMSSSQNDWRLLPTSSSMFTREDCLSVRATNREHGLDCAKDQILDSWEIPSQHVLNACKTLADLIKNWHSIENVLSRLKSMLLMGWNKVKLTSEISSFPSQLFPFHRRYLTLFTTIGPLKTSGKHISHLL